MLWCMRYPCIGTLFSIFLCDMLCNLCMIKSVAFWRKRERFLKAFVSYRSYFLYKMVILLVQLNLRFYYKALYYYYYMYIRIFTPISGEYAERVFILVNAVRKQIGKFFSLIVMRIKEKIIWFIFRFFRTTTIKPELRKTDTERRKKKRSICASLSHSVSEWVDDFILYSVRYIPLIIFCCVFSVVSILTWWWFLGTLWNYYENGNYISCSSMHDWRFVITFPSRKMKKEF